MAAPKKTVKPVAKPAEAAKPTVKPAETAKPEVKPAETVKPAVAVKAEPAAAPKTEEKKPAAAAVAAPKAAEKKPASKPGRKPKATKTVAVKKTAEKKTTVRKTVKKADQKINTYIQFSGKSYSQEELVKIAQDVWKYDLKQKVRELESINLYVKPEENIVYYVMNQEFTGSFGI